MLIVPEEITTEIEAFAQDLSPSSAIYRVPIIPQPGSVTLNCWGNVDRYCIRKGGVPLIGWRLWWIPGVLIEAQAHVIYKSENNELLDITPNADNESECVFVPDENIDGRPGEDFIRSRFKNLCAENFIDDYVHCSHVKAEYNDQVYTSRINQPVPLEVKRLPRLLRKLRFYVKNRNGDA